MSRADEAYADREVADRVAQDMSDVAPDGWTDLLLVAWSEAAGVASMRMWVEGPALPRHRVQTPDSASDLAGVVDGPVSAGGARWRRCDIRVTRRAGSDAPAVDVRFARTVGQVPDEPPPPDPVERAEAHRAAVEALVVRPATEQGPAPVVAVTEDHLVDAMRDWDPATREAFRETARPAVEFARRRPGPAGPALGVSRLGGLPDLPAGTSWPTWTDPVAGLRPMVFFAQVALRGLVSHLDLPLPDTGVLLFFCDLDVTGAGPGVLGLGQGDVAAVAVLHAPEGVPLARTPPPDEVHLVPEALLAPLLSWTHPVAELLDDADAAAEQLDEVLLARLVAAAPDGYEVDGRHQFGGCPRSVQGPVEVDVARAAGTPVTADSPPWVLLLQIGDDQLFAEDHLLGDDGALYWLVPWDELAAGDLSRTRIVLQSL